MCPPSRVFGLSAARNSPVPVDTVDFEIAIKQCEGLDLILDMYESFVSIYFYSVEGIYIFLM